MSAHLWLLPSVALSTEGDDAVFFDGFKHVRLPGLAQPVSELVGWLDGDHGERASEPALGAQLVELLDAHDWLVRLCRPIREVTGGRLVRTRQLSYYAHICRTSPDRAFDELAGKRVFVIGTGGIGSYAAYYLAASGVRELVLNDPDTIEPSNLNRQILFAAADVGRAKVAAVRDALAARFQELRVDIIARYLDYDHLLPVIEGVDLVLVCGEHETVLDRPEVVMDKAIITAGYLGHEVFAGPVVSPSAGTPRWDALIPASERNALAALESTAEPLANHWNCSGATINGVGGALLAEAAVRLLAPSLGGPILLMNRRFLDMRTLSSRDEPFTPGPAEPVQRIAQ